MNYYFLLIIFDNTKIFNFFHFGYNLNKFILFLYVNLRKVVYEYKI